MGKPKDTIRGPGQHKQSTNKKTTRIVNKLAKDALVPSEREKRLLQELFDWQDRSRETHWILGQPLGVRS
jgi:hypothetical protein